VHISAEPCGARRDLRDERFVNKSRFPLLFGGRIRGCCDEFSELTEASVAQDGKEWRTGVRLVHVPGIVREGRCGGCRAGDGT
jgi:hypothetical protein